MRKSKRQEEQDAPHTWGRATACEGCQGCHERFEPGDEIRRDTDGNAFCSTVCLNRVASRNTSGGFSLRPEPAIKPAKKRYASQPTRQRALFTGLDCLPGQGDLF